jgi:predicted nuclease of predicted toxin-antitoxin system
LRFKLDENLPIEIVADLHQAGHDADSVFSEGLVGSPDRFVLQQATAEGRIFLTMDKGVGDLRTYNPQDYAGIVLFRPPKAGRGEALAFIQRHLPAVLRLELERHLLVVTDTGMRSR